MYKFKPAFKLSKAKTEKLAGEYLDGCTERERKLEYLLLRKYYDRKGKIKQLDIDELAMIAYWKTPRTKKTIDKNEAEFVREVTRTAFDPKSSCMLRVQVLQLLRGVGWPTASAIMHLCHTNDYPILDYHALESLGYAAPGPEKPKGLTKIKTYDFDFWRDYTHYTRGLCEKYKVRMRTLDRALWQFSKNKELESRKKKAAKR